jgi:hypothetical protein
LRGVDVQYEIACVISDPVLQCNGKFQSYHVKQPGPLVPPTATTDM